MSVEPLSAAETVELTIRCALQTFEDKAISAPLEWKVGELKSHLHEVCATKPDPKRQRLIYAGHCLEDHQSLREILSKSYEGLENVGPQVIHLVCAPKEAPQMANGLRHRPNAANLNNNNASANAAGQQPSFSFTNSNYFVPTMPSYSLPSNATPEQIAYYANWAGYQQALMMNQYYQQQMMMAAFSPITGPQNLPGYNVHFNLRQNAAQMEQQNQNNNAQPPQPAAPAVNDEEHLNDIVGMIYKSIRVGFFLMVLFFYSSMERFFTVFLIMCVLWFIHRRREQNNLNEAARQVVQQAQQPVQNVDNPEVEQNENEGERQVNNDNNNNEVPAPPRLVNLQDGQTRWNLLWSAAEMADSPELRPGQSSKENTAILANNERIAVSLPPESEERQELKKILQLKEKIGWKIRFFDFQYEKKLKFGLTIRNYEGCVMVSKLESKSLTIKKLFVGDHLFAVNSDIVTDRESAKNLILKSFVKKKKVTLTIYRPYSSEAKLWAKTAILSTSTRTSSTAPREKIKWPKITAKQRQAAKLLAKNK